MADTNRIEKQMIKVGSDFSGVGAFNQALIRLRIDYTEVFACDMDKYARQTFIHNYGEPAYYPTNVYDREIPSESLDIYMTSPPCQAFSMAGKRLGKDDKRGILFFNSHEFIQTNKPRYFIFENVKGLLSDDSGKTFSEWVNLLGGKSVNGNATMFPYPDAVPYHIYWKVLNAKDYGVPQNRERVFIIGIRDDADNSFKFPVEEHLTKRLKDVLEDDVDRKYFLSEKMLNYLVTNTEKQQKNGNGFKFSPTDGTTIGKAVTCKAGSRMDDEFLKIGTWRTHEDGRGFREVEDGNCPTIPSRAREDGSGQPVIQIKSATSKGYEEAIEGDSINFSVPNSETRRGRVGKGVAQTLDTGCQQGVVYNDKRLNKTLEKNNLPKGDVKAIDTYNKKVQDNAPTLTEPHHNTTRLWDGYKIRRLTPRECFRLMDFPDTFTWPVSDSQAYKQAGNSIVVNVLYKIIKNLNLK
jgi:DNA (cytosine-5)-methyltransferase 1